ncbi:hypothetical protein CHS0354_011832 [Potamilus streckersoni]|uniref:YDG domain-containing protein n=1 Tax=Potamilus streckersoni TaxID=2493646 RepID=A0AAE0WBE4_9BIVA|nr:hypothetical protein CHS0354_011832 [Potamilus streckersoni]
MASSYENLRQKNLEDNRRILQEIGLFNPLKFKPNVSFKGHVRREAESDDSPSPKRVAVELELENSESLRGTHRQSARLSGAAPQSKESIQEEVEKREDEEVNIPGKVTPNRLNVYGPIEGVEVGTQWKSRMQCCYAGIHRPTVAGIHPGPEGAYSIALSGGYDDNLDLGDGFTYTGEGGRDLKGTKTNPKNLRTAPQSKDQTLSRGNLALNKSVKTGKPVRVIRGHKLDSPFAPRWGYRYDGLYTVEKAWYTTGLAGFGVWKFALRRCHNQAPPPWDILEDDAIEESDKENSNKEKKEHVSESNESDDISQKKLTTTPRGTKSKTLEEIFSDSGVDSHLHDSQGSSAGFRQTNYHESEKRNKKRKNKANVYDVDENGNNSGTQ